MKIRSTSLASLLASTFILGTAHAVPTTLNFEPFAGTSSESDFGPPPSPFAQNGFDFVFDGHPVDGFDTGFFFIGKEAPCVSACSSNGTAAFFNFNAGSLTVSRSDHGTFSLLGLDAAQAFLNLGTPLELHVVGDLLGGGSMSTVINASAIDANSFAHYLLPNTFTKLTSITFTGSPIENDNVANFALDNILIDPLPEVVVQPTSVAEPGMTALFASGLLGFVFVRRSRRIQ